MLHVSVQVVGIGLIDTRLEQGTLVLASTDEVSLDVSLTVCEQDYLKGLADFFVNFRNSTMCYYLFDYVNDVHFPKHVYTVSETVESQR